MTTYVHNVDHLIIYLASDQDGDMELDLPTRTSGIYISAPIMMLTFLTEFVDIDFFLRS